MEENFRWPKKGDNPFRVKFADRNSPTWASPHWLSFQDFNDSFLAGAFKEAGDKIIKELSRGEDTTHPDKFFIPIGYLYRHSLELKMKHLIRLGIKLGLTKEDEKLSSVLKIHNLCKLWNYVKNILEKHWPDGPKKDINAVEGVIQKFHKIDKSGQNLRYSKNSSMENTLKSLPESVQLMSMQNIFDATFRLLSGCTDALENELELIQEFSKEPF